MLEAAESAQATVVGVVRDPVQLDRHGWSARLTLERVLSGAVPLDAPIRIAWEELAPGRGPRLARDQRVLVALEPLPSHSLWRERIPAQDALALAGNGEALLRSPDERSLERLKAYLDLAPETRKDSEGTDALLRMLTDADPLLGGAALVKLASRPKGALEASARLEKSLAQVARDGERTPSLRRGVLALIEMQRLRPLRGLLIELAVEGSSLELEATTALATLDGGLSADRVARLLGSDEPALRAVAVAHAPGTPHESRLAVLVRSDPAPEVRASAAEALARGQGRSALDQIEPALFDESPMVRVRTARAVGGLGAPVVPRLALLVDQRPPEDASGPIVALAHAGEEGRLALIRISTRHPDRRVQRLALLALGRDVGEH